MRLAGCGIIFLSFISFGILRVRDRRRHLQFLSDMISALRMLSAELQDRRPPMKELLEWTARHTEGETGLFFSGLSKDISKLGEESFDSLWRQSAGTCLGTMSTADYRDLCSLGKMLGRTDLAEQISALNNCCRSLQTRFEREGSEYQDEKKLSLGVSTALGLLVCILIL